MRAVCFGVLGLLPALAACGRGRAAPDPLLSDLAYRVILPGYRAFADRASELRTAADAFVANPSPEGLDVLQEAWSKARLAWGRCEAHFIGPEDDRLLQAKIDTFPVLTSKLEEIVSGSGPLTERDVERFGANLKGFMALEYLIFSPGGNDAAVLAAVGEGKHADRRRSLIAALAANLERVAAEVRDYWDPERGNFAAEFAAPGGSASSYPEKDAAFDDIINRLVAFSEFTADARLGTPLGVTIKSSGKPEPAWVESRLSVHSVPDLLADLEGIRLLYEGGDEGKGLAERVVRMNPDLDRELRQALREAIESVRDISGPLDRALVADSEGVRRAFKDVKRLQYRIAVDLVAVYRTTLMVVPFDGD